MKMRFAAAPRIRGLLISGAALAAAWGIHDRTIAPLLLREARDSREVAEWKQRLEDGRQTIAETHALEQDTARARDELDRLQGELPAGSAMTWLPELVREHFARFGIVVAIVRLNTTLEAADIPGHCRGYWSVGLPVEQDAQSVTGLLLAVAELEQGHSFVRVLDFAIQPAPAEPHRRVAALNIEILFPK